MKKINNYSFFALYGIIFLLILYKVVFIPMTHDETNTPTHYINFSIWQIMMYPDAWPNNHILNTLIVKFFVSIFGINQVVARLPNLLSFIVYAFAVFRINKLTVKDNSIWFIPASLLFVAYPYFLDFFGLCRGYGMSAALAALSLSCLLSGFLFTKNRHVWISYGLAVLASYANFSLLVFWPAVAVLSCFYFYSIYQSQLKQLIKPVSIIALSSLLYLALIATPVYKMKSTNQFVYWSTSGYFSGTITTVIILCLIIAFIVFIHFRLNKHDYKISSITTPVFIASFVLLLTAFVSILQCKILKTPSLSGRTALFFFPLLATAFVCLLGLIPSDKRKRTMRFIAFLISFSCVFNLAYTYSLKYTIQWQFDENTFDVLNYLETKKHPDGAVSLKTDWHFFPSFYFYTYTGKTPWLKLRWFEKDLILNTDAEYYYVFSADYKILEPKFEPVYKITEDRWLLKKRPIVLHDIVK